MALNADLRLAVHIERVLQEQLSMAAGTVT